MFKNFSQAVHAQLTAMSQGELFVVDIDGDALFAAYLAAFPEGTNPVFRERTEHDCSCCKNFIRNVGNVVALRDGQVVTVWDIDGNHLDPEYSEVTRTLAAAVRAAPIKSVFRAEQPSYGAATTKELREGGIVHTWNHFHTGTLPHRIYKGDKAAARIGESATIFQVLRSGLRELQPSAVQTVLELIGAKSLYRGEEKLGLVEGFALLQAQYWANPSDNLVWANLAHPAARFKNDVIGTLVEDLSVGMDLEVAVKRFEFKVAPANYQRTTALITPRMVEDAMKTITGAGLEPALERRFANIHDVSVNDVLWADNSAKSQMKGGIADVLLAVAAPVVKADHAEDISVEDFVANVLPKAATMDVLVRNSMLGNFVAVTAPAHADAPPLFKWDNGFAWSYDGDTTDSIKERVKAAGGRVDGDLLCRLAWEYTDDLDLHMYEPGGGHLFFADRNSRNGGHLDVDANGSNGMMNHPVENIFYLDRKKMRDGVYTLKVNNYTRRAPGAKGFDIEIEFDGQVHSISYDKALRSGETVEVAQIECRQGQFKILKSLPASTGLGKSQQKWGVSTEQFTRVVTLMHSPNHWGGQGVGQRHWLFMLDGCLADVPVRGVYNEFLKPELAQHRKVFEVLGAKTKCQPTSEQLAGVGFNSTRGDKVTVQVAGPKLRKLYNVIF